jgi:hypothetical protein
MTTSRRLPTLARSLVPALALLLLLSACARRIDQPPPKAGFGSYAPNDLVLRVELSGGFTSPAVLVTRLPSFSLYGDGRVVEEGPQPAIYPGPALPSVVQFRVNEDGFQELLRAARAAGLAGADRRLDFPGVADVPTTVFTFFDGTRTHTFRAYALGQKVGVPTPDQRLRTELESLQSRLGDLRSWLPAGSLSGGTVMPIDRLAVLIGAGGPGGGVKEPTVNWPLTESPAALAKPVAAFDGISCLSLGGSQLSEVLPLARKANQLTPWVADGTNYELAFRPLLPDEQGCGALTP